MKSALPFRGIPAPLRRQLTTAAVKAHPCATTVELGATMLALLREASHREERYAAGELPRLSAAHRRLVDAVLLYDCILPSLGAGKFADAFFIRKAIGWALRERSYEAPQEVQAFCREYASRLAPLSVREALKMIRNRSKGDG